MSAKSICSRVLLVAQLLLLSLSAQALESIVKLVPTEGAWVDPQTPNTAWFFDVDEQDFGFIAWYTYDAEGRATFLTLQGQLSYRTEQERRETGVIASLQSPIFEADNGACPTCTPRPANIRPSALGNAEVVWNSARRGSIRYAGRTVSLQVLDLTVPEDRIIEGLWRLDSRDVDTTAGNPHSRSRYASAVVRIFRSAGPIALHTYPAPSFDLPEEDRQNYNFVTLPSLGAAYYTVECVSGCFSTDLYNSNNGESTTTKPNRWVLWFEGGAWRMTNTYLVSSAFPTRNQINGGSLIGEMFVTQNQITVRRRSPQVLTGLLHSGDMVFSRLPINWTRP